MIKFLFMRYRTWTYRAHIDRNTTFSQVISLKTRLTHQEATVQQLHNIRKQMEEVFLNEKDILQVQIQENKQTIQQLEVRLDVSRRTIQDLKEAQATAEKEWTQVINFYILSRCVASYIEHY